MAAQPLQVWSRTVPADWIDYNGHLNEGYYGVAFGDASDALLIELGFDDAYRDAHGTFYTVETHIRFLDEVAEGQRIRCDTVLIGADTKRLHVHHELFAGTNEEPSATQESMMLHVAPGPSVAPMAEPLLTAALDLAAEHAHLPRPDHLGGSVRQLR